MEASRWISFVASSCKKKKEEAITTMATTLTLIATAHLLIKEVILIRKVGFGDGSRLRGR